ncbi:MAG: transglutaminase-like domain-containing protein [Gemmataceae bacterium]
MSRIGWTMAVVVGGLLAAPAAADDAAATMAEWAKKAQGRYAYGVYFSGKKVGYIIEEVKLARRGGQEVVHSTTETFMSTLFDGEKSVKKERSLTCYELTVPGRIVFAEVSRLEDGKQIDRRIERAGKGLKVVTKQGERTLERPVPMPRDTLVHQQQLEAWLQGDRKPGDTFTKFNTSWEEADVDNKQVYTFKERKTIRWDGKPTAVCVVRIDLDGGKMDAVVLPDSRALTGTMGGLLSMKLEKEADARKLDGGPVDLMSVASVVIDRDLGQFGRDIDALTLEVSGVDDFAVPASHRQRVRQENSRTLVELRRDYRVKKADPLTKEQRATYLAATPRIQCDHEAVRNRAKKVIGDATDALEKTRRLEAWVYRTLKKSYSDNADTALEILDNKAGDCTEHALLFVALARAAGVPAREVGGLAYLRGSKPLFGWHAWAEVHDGHQWVSVDPTWHQVYVDGTHLKMSEGDKDLAWANVAGKLKMKVVTVKRKAGTEATEKPPE